MIFIQALSESATSGYVVTKPVIFTNSEELKWVETAPLHGMVSWERGV